MLHFLYSAFAISTMAAMDILCYSVIVFMILNRLLTRMPPDAFIAE